MTDFVTAYLHDEKCGGHQFWGESEPRKPVIGEKYLVVYYCDYDNKDGYNYIIEVTEDNIDELTRRMNDPENDITEYVRAV